MSRHLHVLAVLLALAGTCALGHAEECADNTEMTVLGTVAALLPRSDGSTSVAVSGNSDPCEISSITVKVRPPPACKPGATFTVSRVVDWLDADVILQADDIICRQ